MPEPILDRFTAIDGLRVRYIEVGQGPAVLFLHGASLGSSADVFLDNIRAFAGAGFRAIAYDFPGFGLSEVPEQQTIAGQRNSTPKFIAALGLDRVALVAHSRAGGFAIQLALENPALYSHMIILGTGGLLPPLNEEQPERLEALQTRIDRRVSSKEPTPEDTRKLLEADLYKTYLITEERLALRHSRSIGRNYYAHLARQEDEARNRMQQVGSSIWEKLTELSMPLLMIYGRDDRAQAAERATLLKRLRPEIEIYIVDCCKHMVPWDAAEDMLRLIVPFLQRSAGTTA
jgi:4,5:9,10-diseco-3-hydroxy-5,9,17-trioxoandrosta-1(10),2-diene-4-oate hydrolase